MGRNQARKGGGQTIGLVAVKDTENGNLRILQANRRDNISSFINCLVLDPKDVMVAKKYIIIGHLQRDKWGIPKEKRGTKVHHKELPEDVQKWIEEMKQLNDRITIAQVPASMNANVSKPTKPTVFCPKENKDVPIWHCLGSFIQGRKPCPHMIEAKVNIANNYAEVKCNHATTEAG